jgi:hypothetical protein
METSELSGTGRREGLRERALVIPLVDKFLLVFANQQAAYKRLMSGAAPPSQARA